MATNAAPASASRPAQISIDFTAVKVNRKDFDRLVLPLHDNLYGAAMRLTRNPTEAEDLVQDTMVRAFRFWDSFQEGTNVKAWLFTIQRNAYINGYHKAQREKAFKSDMTTHVMALGSTAAIGNTTSEPPGPAEAASKRDTASKIAAALEILPESYRAAVTMHHIEGLSYKEIAAEMGCPIGTVMSRIYRGRAVLYKALHGHAIDLGIIDDQAATERPSTRKDRVA